MGDKALLADPVATTSPCLPPLLKPRWWNRQGEKERLLWEAPPRRVELERIAHIQRMDDARDVTQDCEQDVDEEVGAAAALQENAERREDDGKDDLADIANKQRNQLTMLALSLKSAGVEGSGGGDEARVEKLRKLWGRQEPPPPRLAMLSSAKTPYLAVKGMMIDICVERTSLFALR